MHTVALMETLANWELFAARERIVKLQKALPSVQGDGTTEVGIL